MTDTPTQHQNQLLEQAAIQSLDNEDGSLFFQAEQQWASEFLMNNVIHKEIQSSSCPSQYDMQSFYF